LREEGILSGEVGFGGEGSAGVDRVVSVLGGLGREEISGEFAVESGVFKVRRLATDG